MCGCKYLIRFSYQVDPDVSVPSSQVTQSFESCGACPGQGGIDCGDIPGAMDVVCSQKKCLICTFLSSKLLKMYCLPDLCFTQLHATPAGSTLTVLQVQVVFENKFAYTPSSIRSLPLRIRIRQHFSYTLIHILESSSIDYVHSRCHHLLLVLV